MLRVCLFLTILLCLFAAAGWAAPKGPLVAGTASYSFGVLSGPDYMLGVHYPFDEGCGGGPYDAMKGEHPINRTCPYAQPDSAKVPGQHAAMSHDIVILSSSRKK